MAGLIGRPSDLAALSTANTFNDLARRAASKGSEMLSLIWEAGRVAKEAKESIPHGEWMKFVEQHYDVDHRSVTRWIQFHEAVPETKLDTVSNLTEGIKMLDPPKDTKKNESRSDTGKPGGVSQPSLEMPPVSEVPVPSETAAETPSCQNYPGESSEEELDETPTQEADPDKEFRTQKSKTAKTVEALMRALDDLHDLRPRLDDHDWAMTQAKGILQSVRNW